MVKLSEAIYNWEKGGTRKQVGRLGFFYPEILILLSLE